MTVVCKYYVARLATKEERWNKDSAPTKTYDIELRAVSDGSAENKLFYAWTPYGQLTLSTKDASLVDVFKGWGEYYLHIEEIDLTKLRELAPNKLMFEVSKLGNRTDATSKKYDVEMVCKDTRVQSGNWNMGTVNGEAAKDFLGMGQFTVTITRTETSHTGP